MKKILTLIICMLTVAAASAKGEPEFTEVSAVGQGIGNGGKPIIAITLAAKKTDKVSDIDFKNAAAHMILFRGWVNAKSMGGIDTSSNHPAICGDPDAQVAHADFFHDFFTSGEVNDYVTIIPESKRVVKKGKVYEITQDVTVDQRALRKKMERAGVIQKLKRAF